MANELVKKIMAANPGAYQSEDDATYQIGLANEHRLDQIAEKYPDFKDDYKRILDEVNPISPAQRIDEAQKAVTRGFGSTLAEIPEAIGIAGHQIFGDPTKLPDNIATDFAQGMRDAMPQGSNDVRLQDSFLNTKLPEAVGSGISFIAGSSVARLGARGVLALAAKSQAKGAVGKAAQAALKGMDTAVGQAASSSAMGAMVNAPGGFQDAMAHTDDIDKAYESFWLNSMAGTTEGVGIGRLGAKLFTRIEKIVGGKNIRKLIVKSTPEGLEEAIQDVAQGQIGDMIAKDIVKYDPDRVMFQDIAEQATTSGSAGFVISFMLNGIQRRVNAIEAENSASNESQEYQEGRSTQKESEPAQATEYQEAEKTSEFPRTPNSDRLDDIIIEELKKKAKGPAAMLGGGFIGPAYDQSIQNRLDYAAGKVGPNLPIGPQLPESIRYLRGLSELERRRILKVLDEEGVTVHTKSKQPPISPGESTRMARLLTDAFRSHNEKVLEDVISERSKNPQNPFGFIDRRGLDGWGLEDVVPFDQRSELEQKRILDILKNTPFSEIFISTGGTDATGTTSGDRGSGAVFITNDDIPESGAVNFQTESSGNVSASMSSAPGLFAQGVEKIGSAFPVDPEAETEEEAASDNAGQPDNFGFDFDGLDLSPTQAPVSSDPKPSTIIPAVIEPTQSESLAEYSDDSIDLYDSNEMDDDTADGVITILEAFAGQNQVTSTEGGRKIASIFEAFQNNPTVLKKKKDEVFEVADILDTELAAIRQEDIAENEAEDYFRDRDKESESLMTRQIPSFFNVDDSELTEHPVVKSMAEILNDGLYDEAISFAARFGQKEDGQGSAKVLAILEDTTNGKYYLASAGKKVIAGKKRMPVVYIPTDVQEQGWHGIQQLTDKGNVSKTGWVAGNTIAKKQKVRIVGFARLADAIPKTFIEFDSKLEFDTVFGSAAQMKALQSLKTMDERKFVALDMQTAAGQSVENIIGDDQVQDRYSEEPEDLPAGFDMVVSVDEETGESKRRWVAKESVNLSLEQLQDLLIEGVPQDADTSYIQTSIERFLNTKQGAMLTLNTKEFIESDGNIFERVKAASARISQPIAEAYVYARDEYGSLSNDEMSLDFMAPLEMALSHMQRTGFRSNENIPALIDKARTKVDIRRQGLNSKPNPADLRNSEINEAFYRAAASLRNRGIDVRVIQKAVESARFMQSRLKRSIRLAISDIVNPSLTNWRSLIHEAGHAVMSELPKRERDTIIKAVQYGSYKDFGLDGYRSVIDKDMPDADLEHVEDMLVEAAARATRIIGLQKPGVSQIIRKVMHRVKMIYLSAANALHRALTGRNSIDAVTKYFSMRVEASLAGGTVTDFATWAAGPIQTMFGMYTMRTPEAFSGIRLKEDGVISTYYMAETSIDAVEHNMMVDSESWDPNVIVKNQGTPGGAASLSTYNKKEKAKQLLAQYVYIQKKIIEPFMNIVTSGEDKTLFERAEGGAVFAVTGIPKRSQPKQMIEKLQEKGLLGGLSQQEVSEILSSDNPLSFIENNKELRQTAEKTINGYLHTISSHARTSPKSPQRTDAIISKIEEEIEQIRNGRLMETTTHNRVLKETAKRMLRDFANRNPKNKSKLRAGFGSKAIANMYETIMGEKADLEGEFGESLYVFMAKLNAHDFTDTLNSIGSILSESNLFDGKNTDWERLHDIVLQKAKGDKGLRLMTDPAYASFVYTALKKRPDVQAALEVKRSGKLDLRKFSNLIELQLSNRPKDLERLAEYISELEETGIKVQKILDHIKSKQKTVESYKRIQRKRLAAQKAYQKIESIDRQKASSDKALGLTSMVTSKGHTLFGTSWHEWQLTPGAQLINPQSPDIPSRDLSQSAGLITFSEAITGKNLKLIASVLSNQSEWLANNKQNESEEANLVRKQYEQLLAFQAVNMRADITRNWFQAFIGSPLERLHQINTPLAKSLVQSLTRYAKFSEEYANSKVATKVGTPWDTAFAKASSAFKMRHRGDFVHNVYEPVLHYIANREDISDTGRVIDEAINVIAFKHVSPNEGIDRTVATQALRNLIDMTASAVTHQGETSLKMGLKVSDEITTFHNGVLKKKGILREHIGEPIRKVPRYIRPMMSLVSKRLQSLIGGEGDKHKARIKEMKEILSGFSEDTAEEISQSLAGLDAVFSDETVYRDFVTPLFKAEINNILTNDKVSEFWSDVGGVAINDSSSVLEALQKIADEYPYILEGSDMKSRELAFQEMAAKVMLRLVEKHEQLRNIVDTSPKEGAPIMMNNLGIRHLSMDARKSDGLPHEWLGYAQFSPPTVRSNYNVLAMHAAMGRDMVSWNARIDELMSELGGMASAYENSTKGGITDKEILGHMVREHGKEEGRRLFDLHKNAKEFRKYVARTKSAWTEYVSNLQGVPIEMKASNEMVGSLAGFTLQSIGSIITELSNIFIQPLIQYGPIGGTKGAFLAAKGTAARLFNSLMHVVTGEVMWLDKIMKDYHEIGRGDDSMMAGFREQFINAMNTQDIAEERSGLKRGVMKFNRLARASLSVGVGRRGRENSGLVDSFQPLAPYSMLQNNMAFGVTYMNWKKFGNLIMDVAKIVDGKSTQEVLSMDLKAEDLMKENGRWAAVFGANRETEALLNMAGKYGINVAYAAAEYNNRKADNPSTDPLTIEMKSEIAAMTAAEFTLDSGFNTRSPIFVNTTAGRIISPLFSWPIAQLSKIAGTWTPKSSDWQARVSAVRAAGWPIVATMPIAIALSYLRDWYEEEALGKRSARPDIFNTDKPLQAFAERYARVGTLGMAGDIFNRMVNPDPSVGVMDLGKSIYVFSLLNQFNRSVSEAINSDMNLTYPSFYRTLIQSFGGGGYMQYVQITNKMMGLNNAESQATMRIHVGNLVRLGGKAIGLEVRPFAQGMSATTPYKPYVKIMGDAAMSGDNDRFVEAYKQALKTVALDKKEPDPRRKVLDSFTARHPLRGAFKSAITTREYARLLESMSKEEADAVRRAVANFNRYLTSIGGQAYSGSK